MWYSLCCTLNCDVMYYAINKQMHILTLCMYLVKDKMLDWKSLNGDLHHNVIYAVKMSIY
jgi:hypothetical protein